MFIIINYERQSVWQSENVWLLLVQVLTHLSLHIGLQSNNFPPPSRHFILHFLSSDSSGPELLLSLFWNCSLESHILLH